MFTFVAKGELFLKTSLERNSRLRTLDHRPVQRLLAGAQPVDEPLHRTICATKAVLGGQILVDALRRQSGFELGLDDRLERFALLRPAPTAAAVVDWGGDAGAPGPSEPVATLSTVAAFGAGRSRPEPVATSAAVAAFAAGGRCRLRLGPALCAGRPCHDQRPTVGLSCC